jgi:uncharacterized protein (DUF736 family)
MAVPAWKAASELAEGYLSLNPVTLKRYEKHELDALQKEIEKLTLATRIAIVPTDDSEAAQAKNRKLLRLSQAAVVLKSWRSRMGI